jgi:hypothetical protein
LEKGFECGQKQRRGKVQRGVQYEGKAEAFEEFVEEVGERRR